VDATITATDAPREAQAIKQVNALNRLTMHNVFCAPLCSVIGFFQLIIAAMPTTAADKETLLGLPNAV
jgi:hypothetical protein